MDDTFKIFVYRLQVGQVEQIEETLSPEFLEIDDHEILFHFPVILKGTAEVTDGMLIIKLSITTHLTMPCAICNENVLVKILIPDFYITEPLNEIKSGVYNYRASLREAILLAIPYTAECHQGDCPERKSLAKYFSKITGLGD